MDDQLNNFFISILLLNKTWIRLSSFTDEHVFFMYDLFFTVRTQHKLSVYKNQP